MRARVFLIAAQLIASGLAFSLDKTYPCASEVGSEYVGHTTPTIEPVFFATDRNGMVPAPGNEPGGMQYGQARVRFEDSSQRNGEFDRMEAPLNWQIEEVVRLSPDETLRRVAKSADSPTTDPLRPRDSVVVYIHGFGNDFHQAICRTAEIKYRTRFEGSMVLFSWPASPVLNEGEFLANLWNVGTLPAIYQHDAGTMNHSIDDLAGFLNALRKQFAAKRTVLVSHSMGSRLLLESLAKLPAEPSDLYRAVVLLAPDVPVPEFEDALPKLRDRAERVSIYINRKDRALYSSQIYNALPNWTHLASLKDWTPRAGATAIPGKNKEAETVDITDATAAYGDALHHSDHLLGTALYDLLWNVVRNMPGECRQERGLATWDSYRRVWHLNVTDTRYSAEGLSPECQLIRRVSATTSAAK